MGTKRQAAVGYRYGAEEAKGDDGTSPQNKWYAVVYGPGQVIGGADTTYAGTSMYADKSAAETEAHAWCRDRGYTAHPF